MEEPIGFDIECDWSDGTDACKRAYNREEDGDSGAEHLHSIPQSLVIRQLTSLQKCQCREHKVQRGEPNRSTDWYKVPKKWHCCGDERDCCHVCRSVQKPPQAGSASPVLRLNPFFEVRKCRPAVYLSVEVQLFDGCGVAPNCTWK